MNHRKIIVGVLVFSVVALVLAFVLTSPCHSDQQYMCDGVLGESVGFPLGLNAAALFVVSIILFFFTAKVLKTWAVFAVLYCVLSASLIASTPVGQSGALGLNPDREVISLITGIGFIVASIVVIVVSHIKSRNKHSADVIINLE